MKSKHRIAFSVLALAILLIQCAKPKLLRRHHAATYVASEDTAMMVSAFALEISEPSKAVIATLPERAQKALIETMGQLSVGAVKDPVNDIARLQQSLMFKPGSPERTVIDKTVFKKRIVISYEDLNLTPGERFDFSKIRISLPDSSGLEFVSWDKIETKYESIDFGKIGLTNASTFTIEGTAGTQVAGEKTSGDNKLTTTNGLSVTPSFSKSVTMTEEQLHLERYINITGTLNNNEITLIRGGAKGLNLDGSVVVELTMRANPSVAETKVLKCKNLFIASGPEAPANLKLSFVRFKIPASTSPVTANLRYTYRLRSFGDKTAGYARTIPEYDDVVKFVRPSKELTGKGFQLVSENELAKYFFVPVIKDRQIHYLLPESAQGYKPLLFESYEEAAAFARWLVTTRGQRPQDQVIIGGDNCGLYIGATDTGLTWGDVGQVDIYIYN